jgi:EAL domain-containing protein (putative c-di-GMP-specific phosphodiesterase class I)
VRAVQTLASALGIPVVAEYVETCAIYELLTEMGVEYMQGYLAGAPRATPYADEELFLSDRV